MPRRFQVYPSFLFLGLGVLIVVGIVATWHTVQLVTTIRYQQERMTVKRELADIRKVLQQIDANEQYYSVTGNNKYFDQLVEVIPDLQQEKKDLNYVLAKVQHGHNIEIFNYLVDRKAKLIENFLALEGRSNSNRLRALKRLNSRENRQMSKDLKSVMAAMDMAETQAINEQDTVVDRYSLISMLAIVIGLMIAFFLVAIFGWRSWKEIERRARTEKDLRRAQEAAVVSSKLKSQFLATVSHEIRTPLNGIIGLSDLLQEQVKNDEEKRLAGIIHHSGQSLLRIVNDILDFSKIEAGKIELEIQKFSIRNIVQSALELHSLKARSKDLLLMSHLDKQIPAEMYGDAERLNQVLNNLIGNAIKFTEKGEIVVRSKIIREDVSKVFLQFSVEDTGIGISKEEQAYLFQPFNQLHSALADSQEGTGLGLSISKSIIEKMGGSIRVYSRPGLGSQFIFEVPFDRSGTLTLEDEFPKVSCHSMIYVGKSEYLKSTLQTYAFDLNMNFYVAKDKDELVRLGLNIKAQERVACFYHQEDGIVESRRLNPQITGYAISNETNPHIVKYKSDQCRHLQFPLTRAKFIESLNCSTSPKTTKTAVAVTPVESEAAIEASGVLALVVEDNPTNQILIKSYLDKFGIRSHMTANGQEALVALDRAQYDVILMDCRMPIMDGFETTEKIRSLEASSHIRTPIIAMTANAMKGDRDRCISAGMDDYISKPFEPNDLLEMINKWTKYTEQVHRPVLEELAEKTSYEVVHKMIESFVVTLDEGLKLIEKGKSESDFAQVRFYAHKLKSSSAALGAKVFAQLCSDVEADADENTNDLDKINRLVLTGAKVLVEMKQLAGLDPSIPKTASDSLHQSPSQF